MSTNYQILNNNNDNTCINIDTNDNNNLELTSVHSDEICLKFRTLENKIYEIKLPTLENVTILQLKEQLFTIYNIPIHLQRFIFTGRELKDDEFASNCNLESGCVVNLLIHQANVINDDNNNMNTNSINNDMPVGNNNPPLVNNNSGDTIFRQELNRYSDKIANFSTMDMIIIAVISFDFILWLLPFPFAMAGYKSSKNHKFSYALAYFLLNIFFFIFHLWMLVKFLTFSKIEYSIFVTIMIIMRIYMGLYTWKFLQLLKRIR